MKRWLAAALLPLALAAALAGCTDSDDNDDGVATAGGDATDQPDDGTGELTEDEMYEAQLAFAACMREHGVDMEDPERGGGITIGGGDPTEVDAANEECRHLLPNGGEPREASPEQQEQLLAFAQCMRENGIENFPDPQDGGGIAIQDGLDPMDPAFQAAEETCQEQLGMEPGRRTTDN